MANDDWKDWFKKIYDLGAERYRAGRQTPAEIFESDEVKFLKGLGCSAHELFDFVEDGLGGSPTYAEVEEVTAIRRDYFLNELKGEPTGIEIDAATLPAKAAAVDGISWLPRIIPKAKAKLRGEMPPELMYGCGGDRPFLKSVNVGLGEFLQVVRDAGDDNRKVIDFVKERAGRN
jgi:hypothetical protein